MIFHPPLLYMVYVGVSVVFAVRHHRTVGWPARLHLGTLEPAVDHRRVDIPHLRHRSAVSGRTTRLGWGGWWFWDPVDLALHAVAGWHRTDLLAGGHREARCLQGVDGAAGNCCVLAVAARHLPRPLGCATSVHAFATDPRRAAVFILAFPGRHHRRLADLYALRAPKVNDGGRFGLLSRGQPFCSATTCC